MCEFLGNGQSWSRYVITIRPPPRNVLRGGGGEGLVKGEAVKNDPGKSKQCRNTDDYLDHQFPGRVRKIMEIELGRT